MKVRFWWLIVLSVCTGFAYAQAPVEEGQQIPDAVLDTQQKAGMAYRDWQDAAKARAQLETEFKQATTAYQSAQQQSSDAKRRAETAKKLLEAAQAQEIKTHDTYDKAVAAVNRVWGKKAPSKP
jgi:septal ring factor EnvC (AmiA/AmiB activator)